MGRANGGNQVKRIDGTRLGRWSLRLDAAYCALLGAGLAVAAPRVASAVGLPARVLTAAGVLVVIWAGLVVWLLARTPLRGALRLVMTVNILAAVAVATVSLAAAITLAALAVLTVAVDVALFAVSQGFALRRLAHVPQG